VSAYKWFTYRQNNSGGSFDHFPEDGIGIVVFMEANDRNHANARAERLGLYFDGCAKGADCSCCGDRWSEPWDEDGTDQPELWGEAYRPVADGEKPAEDWGIPFYIHPMVSTFTKAVKASP